ncbi:GAP family protein [Microbacterium sp. G2-8]|uniref:GAP family protein n=1 Tax=Microbacterium sp. G2-8 TaxID=2842454 RepID=UPI001C8A8B07|nr:GAP family protein [Microbacterium sp. G2-8]
MLWALLPIALGVMASPLAVMALIGVLLSPHARRNGVAYLLGWLVAIVLSLVLWDVVFVTVAIEAPLGPATWARVVHLLLAAGLATGSVVTFRRARTVLARMSAARTPDEIAAATPQLPGIMRSATHFTAARAFVVGGGIFLLNPLNMSLVIAAALEIALSAASFLERSWLIAGFVLAAAAPVAVPVLFVCARGPRAAPMLARLRAWVARNHGLLSAGLLLLVAVIQLGKGLDGLFAGA